MVGFLHMNMNWGTTNQLLFLYYHYYKIIFSFQSDFQYDGEIGAIEIARVELYRKATDVDCHDSVVLRRHKIF